MLRRVLWLLLLVPWLAHAQIVEEASGINGADDGATAATISSYSTDADVDLLLVFLASDDSDSDEVGTPTFNSNNFTFIGESATPAGQSGDQYMAVWGMVSPGVATSDISVPLTNPNTFFSGWGIIAVSISGTDTASVAAATNFLEGISDTTGSTTISFSSAGTSGNGLICGANFKGGDQDPLSADTAGFVMVEATDTNTTGDTAVPVANVAFDGDGAPSVCAISGNSTDENAGVYVELVAAAAGGPSFTSGPTVAAATNGYTISGTITGANATVYAAALNPGASAPADCDALQALSGTAPIFASEAWTADAGDSFALTAAGSWPRHDVYVCADDGTNPPTALSSFADQNRSADTGQAILVLTSVATTSIFDDDAYFGPDVATGDVVEYDTASSIGCTIAFEADGDFTVTVDAGQTGCDVAGEVDDYQNFDYNVQDASDTSDGDFDTGPPTWATGDDTVWINNSAPVCDGDQKKIWEVDEAVSEDLDTYCTDANGGQLTYTLTSGTSPTGVSLTGATGAISGTPTVENETVEVLVYTATDEASDTDTVTWNTWVPDTITVPTYTDGDTGDAVTDHSVAFPMQSEQDEPSTWHLIEQSSCSDAEAAGQVTAQDPAASTEVAWDADITITVSTGLCPSGKRTKGVTLPGVSIGQ